MGSGSSWRGWIVVPSCILLPIPAAILAVWLNPEHEGMCVDLFIIFGAFPISWTFAGIGCWVLGRIWNHGRTVHTFQCLPVEYCGLILFIVGFSLSLFGLWKMYQNGLFA